MVLTTSTPNEINFQSMRKRKRNEPLYSSLFESRFLQSTYEITENENKENNNRDEITENENKENNLLTDLTNYGPNRECSSNDNSQSLINDDIEIKEEDLPTENTEVKSECNDDDLHSQVTVCKVEDLREDAKIHNSLENIEITDVRSENPQSSTCSNLDTGSTEDWELKDIKTEPEEHQKEKLPNSNDDDTPSKQKRRRLGTDSINYDQLSDERRLELFNNECEHTDMLHDLSSLMNFDVNKIDTNLFCSTINNTMETEEKTEKSRDPETSPLSTEENVTADGAQVQRIKLEDTEDIDNNNTEMYDYIKDVLGDLDIELTEEEQSENEVSEVLTEEEQSENEVSEEDDKDWKEENAEESNESSDELTENALQELYTIKIKMLHEVPPQHKVEHTAGTKTLTKSQKKQFLMHGPMKTGLYTPKEDKIILKNWHTFCETHNWNPQCTKPFTKMKYGTKFYIKHQKERQKFVQFLANGLPWRPLQSVYRRFRYLHGNYNLSYKRYSTAEDEKILHYVNNTSRHNVFARLSSVLHRQRKAIGKHYQRIKQNLHKRPSKNDVKWTLQLIGKFIETFIDVTLNESVEDLKNASIPISVWRKLEKKLHIDSYVLNNFWMYQLHMQLFSPEPIYLNDIKIKLIEYVYGKGISSTREIVWSNVAKCFDGFTTIFLAWKFLHLVQQAIRKLNTRHFPDIIEYLYSEKRRIIMNAENDKFLPRLVYHKGKVKIRDEDA